MKRGRNWFKGCRILAVFLIALVAATSGWQTAQGQVTVENLIGDAVSDIGNEFKDIETAITLFNRGLAGDALKLLEAAKEKDSRLAPAEVMMAKLWLSSKNGNAARASLENAVKNHPDDPEAFIAFGEIAFSQGRVSDAQALFEKGQSLGEEYARNQKRKRNLRIRCYSGLTAVAESRNQWPEAEAILGEWIKTDPDNTNPYQRLARAQAMQKTKEKLFAAYETYHKLASVDKDVPIKEINMALMYEQLARGDEEKGEEYHLVAKNLMSKAEERAADDVDTRLAIAQWAIDAGYLDQAKRNVESALKLDKNSTQGQLLKGLIDRYQGDFASAEKIFREANYRTPGAFGPINNLALALAAQGDADKNKQALEFAQLATRIYNDGKQATGREAAATLAWVLFKQGREAEAERGVIAVAKVGPVSTEANINMAEILVARNRVKDAYALLKNVLKNKRPFPQKDKAQKMLDQLVKRNPDLTKEPTDRSEKRLTKPIRAQKKVMVGRSVALP
jgi:Tfp pilus assembly protein PilF